MEMMTNPDDYKVTTEMIKVSGKFQVLDRILVPLIKKNHRVLIFSQFTTILDLLEDYCDLRKWRSGRIDGTSKMNDREDTMCDFNSPDSDMKVFLLSTRAGGLGLNLTGADTVVIFDSDWVGIFKAP